VREESACTAERRWVRSMREGEGCAVEVDEAVGDVKGSSVSFGAGDSVESSSKRTEGDLEGVGVGDLAATAA
jgi:hypothetical protein